MRLRKVKRAQEFLNENEDIVIQTPECYPGQWHVLFKNDNPIYLEIGMGKGQFLIEMATNNPNINFIGLEKEESVLIRAVEKLKSKSLNNILFIHEDAFLIKTIFNENEISKIYLNFSDPWPKSRHAKRRLTHNTILENYRYILKNKGTIELKTDNRLLFEYSLQEFVRNKLNINKLSLDLHADNEEIVTTEYEDKFVSKGNIIYFIEVESYEN